MAMKKMALIKGPKTNVEETMESNAEGLPPSKPEGKTKARAVKPKKFPKGTIITIIYVGDRDHPATAEDIAHIQEGLRKAKENPGEPFVTAVKHSVRTYAIDANGAMTPHLPLFQDDDFRL